MRCWYLMSCLALSLITPIQLHAQNLPSFFNSNEIEQRLPLPNLPADSYRPSAPSPELPNTPPAPDAGIHMQTPVPVRNIRIEGGSLYSIEELAKVYQPLTGRNATLEELIAATRSITQRYHDDGYPLSFAFLPEQDFFSGNIRIVLVEGYIANIEIDPAVGPVRKKVEAIANKLRAERPLSRKTFERYSSLLNTLPGITTETQVPPPSTTDGASTMTVRALRKPFTSSMNLSTSSRDDIQAIISLSSQARTAWGEQLSISALAPPGEDDERYFRLDYSQHLGTEGTQLLLSGSRYRANPHDKIHIGSGVYLSQHRENDRVSVGVKHPLIAAPDRWWNIGAQIYAVNDLSRYKVLGYGMHLETDSHVRALGIESDWRQSTQTRMRLLNVGLYQGFDRFGAKKSNDFGPSNTDLDFFRLRLSAVQSDRFAERWQGVMSGAVYWSNDHLPESEKAIFGGQNFARGYPNDQASGDKGWGASYEINYSYPREGTWLRILQPYFVLDTAKTWYNEPTLASNRMSSAAVGLRFGDSRYYNLSIEGAKPMGDKALDSHNRAVRYTLTFSYQL